MNSQTPSMDSQTMCVRAPANIGPRGQRFRMILGIVALGAAAWMDWQLTSPGIERAWRLTLFVPLYVATMCLLQAREKT